MDGRWCTVVMSKIGNDKLITHQKSEELDPPINTVVTRQFYREKMVMTLQCQEVTSTAEFQRLKTGSDHLANHTRNDGSEEGDSE